MSLCIRKFEETDRAALKQIYFNTRVNTFYWMRSTRFEIEDFDADTKDEEIWVAEADGVIAGFIAVWMPQNFVHHLYIDKSFHRLGIGKALLDAVAKHCYDELSLKCLINNVNAFNFYASLGWRVRANEIDDLGRYFLMSKQIA